MHSCLRGAHALHHGTRLQPKRHATFTSSCLDQSVKMCSLGSLQSNFTLEAHEKGGVNYVEFYAGADKPYLLTCEDDRTVKVLDYHSNIILNTTEANNSVDDGIVTLDQNVNDDLAMGAPPGAPGY